MSTVLPSHIVQRFDSKPSFPPRVPLRIIVGKEKQVFIDKIGEGRRGRGVGVDSVGGVDIGGIGGRLSVGGVHGVERVGGGDVPRRRRNWR